MGGGGGGVSGWVAWSNLVSAQGPLVLGLGLQGLGLRDWGQGLTICLYLSLAFVEGGTSMSVSSYI